MYLAKCRDGSLYCGVTNDLKSRMSAHNAGKGARYTRARRPVSLAWSISVPTKSDALKLEHRIKKLSRLEKLRLVACRITAKEDDGMPKHCMGALLPGDGKPTGPGVGPVIGETAVDWVVRKELNMGMREYRSRKNAATRKALVEFATKNWDGPLINSPGWSIGIK